MGLGSIRLNRHGSKSVGRFHTVLTALKPYNSGMKRFVISSLMLFSVVLAQAQISVKPYGDQVINADQSQTLPQGGIVDDSKHGVKIDAKYLEFKAGEYVRAKTATISTKGGQKVSTTKLNYLIKTDRMEIAGPLNFSDEFVSGLSSAAAVVYPDADVMVGVGGVKAVSPQLSANAMVVDGARKEAFLYGNYKFKSQDGKIKLGNQGAQAGLLISFANRDRPRVTSGADVPAASRARFLQLIEASK
jgi:hypothetical protein